MIQPVHRLARRFLAGTTLVAIALAATLAMTTAPAAAHSKLNPQPSCGAGELPHFDVFSGQVSVFVYYSSANGGTNCAWAQKNVNRTTAEPLGIALYRCATGNPNAACNPTAVDTDSGNFQYYAGPVRVTGTAGGCILIQVIYRSSRAEIGPVYCS
ncbi:hypothetical protein OG792_23160 [Micromonospora sp. NBC_01699]|uniref:hypothetical protein n=1 Tax=Micromonospora sp. NBC_01699 TaxID=2975984 RepID=UPI002E2C6BA5|nr:hypothetical protein [Micromonospora sp. NBC_01699]